MKRIYVSAETATKLSEASKPGETQDDTVNRLLNVYYIVGAERERANKIINTA